MNQLLEDTLRKLEKQTDQAEIYMQQDESTDVDILNNNINHAKEENVVGLGIRVIKDQRQGFAYTTNVNRIDQTIEQALTNSKLNKKDPNLVIIDDNKKYSKIDGLYDKSIENLELKDSIEYSQRLLDLTEKTGCRPTSGGYGTSINTTSIVNTNGIDLTETTSMTGASLSVNVDDNDLVSSAFYFDMSHDKNLDLELIVDKSTQLALNSRNAKPTETRDTQVVLDHIAAISLMYTFFSALSSENKQRGRSRFAQKLDQQVSSENLTITDDGTLPEALHSSISDDEGTPTEKTVLIEDGILKSFIYDSYHANKDEDDVKTTANAVRSSYSSVPSVGFTNIKLDYKEKMSIEDIKEGVMIDSVMGAHTANPITGDFSVEGLNAFEIKNGSIENPIKKIMLSGNIFDIMMDAIALDGQVRQLRSCITPRILVNNLRVIG